MKAAKAGVSYGPGTYLHCQACGHVLTIRSPRRRVLCSCGQEITALVASDRATA
jgi:hypothetical protein